MHVHVQQTQQRRKVHFRRQELPAWRAAPLLALGSQPAAHPRHSPLHVMRAGRLATLLAYEAAAAARPALERVPVGLINLRAVAAVWAVPEAVPQVALAVAAARRHRHPCMAAAGEQAPARARASVRALAAAEQQAVDDAHNGGRADALTAAGRGADAAVADERALQLPCYHCLRHRCIREPRRRCLLPAARGSRARLLGRHDHRRLRPPSAPSVRRPRR